jgi:hypothetical protein
MRMVRAIVTKKVEEWRSVVAVIKTEYRKRLKGDVCCRPSVGQLVLLSAPRLVYLRR